MYRVVIVGLLTLAWMIGPVVHIPDTAEPVPVPTVTATIGG